MKCELDINPVIDLDIHVSDESGFFSFKILALPQHRFKIVWGDGTEYASQGDGAWRYYSYDYSRCGCRTEYHVTVYTETDSEILGLDVDGTDIYGTCVTRLDTSRCLSLQELKIENCPNLDLSRNPHLKVLRCEFASFDMLDISSNSELEDLYVNASRLQSLDLSGCPNLRNLVCKSFDINSLDLSCNPNLRDLECHCGIENLDLSHNRGLESLDVGYCQFLRYIDLSTCCKLRYMNFSNCPVLTQLKLPELSMLESACYEESGIVGRKEDRFLKYLLKQKKLI